MSTTSARDFRRYAAEPSSDSGSLCESDLQQAHKLEAIATFAAGLAHDFANLLTSIGGRAHLLRADLADDDPRQRDVDEILCEVERANLFVRQLLFLGSTQVVNKQLLDLNDVLTDLEPLLRRLALDGVEFVTQLAGAPCPITADPVQIAQIVYNLAMNARDAMPGGGCATFTAGHAHRDGHGVVTLTVRDDGVGMDPATCDMIFEPFFTTKPESLGSGLGLSVVRAVVAQNNGTIDVDTELGCGTSLCITLPSAPSLPRARARDAAT